MDLEAIVTSTFNQAQEINSKFAQGEHHEASDGLEGLRDYLLEELKVEQEQEPEQAETTEPVPGQHNVQGPD